MKKVLIVAMAMFLAVFGVSLVVAGDYHFGQSLLCSDCHVMHASMKHSYAGNGAASTWSTSNFLTKGGPDHVCLECHDGQASAPDVVAAGTSPPVGGRSAGGLNKVSGLLNGYDTYMGHTLGSTDPAPGGTGSFTPDATHGLTCVDCHLQHGRNVGGTVSSAASVNPFRNLKALGATGSTITISYNKSVSVPVTDPNGTFSSTNELTKDVFVTAQREYDQNNVNLNEPNATDSGFAAWCSKCHVDLHGAVGSAAIGGITAGGTGYEDFVRHPAATVNIGEFTDATGSSHGHSSNTTFTNTLYRVRVMSPTGDWGTQGTAWTGHASTKDLTPTCVSCHKAHGSKNAFGLIYAKGAAALGEDGDGTEAKNLCKQCHGQGAN